MSIQLRLLLAGLLALGLLPAQVALAVPPLPSSFYGYITLGGQPVAANTQLEAWIGTTRYATATIGLYQGLSIYTLNVPGDDPATPEREGGLDGETVTFRLADHTFAQTASWHSGSNQAHDLHTPADAVAHLHLVLPTPPTALAYGQPSTLNFTLTNTGTAPATNVVLTTTLTGDFLLSPISLSQGACSTPWVCQAGTLPPSQIITGSLTLTPTRAAQTITFSLQASAADVLSEFGSLSQDVPALMVYLQFIRR